MRTRYGRKTGGATTTAATNDALNEPVDVCAGRAAVRSGISTEVYLPHGKAPDGKAKARTWVDLFGRADTLFMAKGYFAPEFTAMVEGLVGEFVKAWASDQKR